MSCVEEDGEGCLRTGHDQVIPNSGLLHHHVEIRGEVLLPIAVPIRVPTVADERLTRDHDPAPAVIDLHCLDM